MQIKTFKDIPQFPFSSYKVNIGWDYLEKWIESHQRDGITLDMNPFYQRGYVWTDKQKIAYIEYQLRGGFSGKDIFWNCPTWMNFKENNVVSLVDGKQRLSAVLDFLHNKIKVFNLKFSEFEDNLHTVRHDFIFHINNLQTEKEVVEWYLGLNTGGSIHTEKDLKPALDYLKNNPGEPNTCLYYLNNDQMYDFEIIGDKFSTPELLKQE